MQLFEAPGLSKIIRIARSAPSEPLIPSAKTMRRRLHSIVEIRQQSALRTLPPNTKLSLALDCWTSPYNQAFMAITAYFVDANWMYQEVLLGFKPVHGVHSGSNLSQIVLQILEQYQIQDRIYGITTDNATNNKTMIEALQQSLPPDITVIRIPCLAHVIQLSLNELLGKLKASPQNEDTETRWTEQHSAAAKKNAQNHNIAATLNKVRYLAIYVNASPQRRETFLQLQPKEPRLVPVQDVKTRWNSTFLMLRRAKRIRLLFEPFCEEYDCTEMLLTNDEWRQIDYLLCITQPFFDYTTELSKTKDVTTHLVFKLYNALFNHIEQAKKQLKRKRIPWKQQMLTALDAGHDKLRVYYAQTDHMRGHTFAVSTMLAPDSRFRFFLSEDWDHEWRVRYRRSFQTALSPYQTRLLDSQSTPDPRTQPTSTSRLSKMLSGNQRARKPTEDEMSQYLDGGM
jgi:hypothetical protein